MILNHGKQLAATVQQIIAMAHNGDVGCSDGVQPQQLIQALLLRPWPVRMAQQRKANCRTACPAAAAMNQHIYRAFIR